MVAGLNLLVNIWKYTYPADDTQGGALPSGTIVYSKVQARIQAERPTQALVEQGLEMPTMFSAVLHPGTLQIEMNNEVEVTHPAISHLYNKHFRVVGVLYTSTYADDPRGYVLLTLKRVERAHGIQ
jgi:hypothetical protein